MICRCRKFARCLACILADGLTRRCTCHKGLLTLGVADVDCPQHGLTASTRSKQAA